MVTDIYFVDCENVGLRHIYGIRKTSLIYFFHSSDLPASFDLQENEFFIPVIHNGGKDTLDFIIDSYIGYEMRSFGKSVTYHIVSRDTGFENIASYWGSLGFKVRLNKDAFMAVELQNINSSIYKKYCTLKDSYRRKIYNTWLSWSNTKNKVFGDLQGRILRLNLGDTLSEVERFCLCDYLYTNGLTKI